MKHKVKTFEELHSTRHGITNVNNIFDDKLSLQERIASKITNVVGSMWCAYVFACIALISLPDAIQGGTATIISWIAQTFLQLVLLSIIMVGQKVESKHSELRNNSHYDVSIKTEEEIDVIIKHLENQNELLELLYKNKLNNEKINQLA
jgi:uncharacterized membrane protein